MTIRIRPRPLAARGFLSAAALMVVATGLSHAEEGATSPLPFAAESPTGSDGMVVTSAAPPAEDSLLLEAVLESASLHFPSLQALQAELDLRAAQLQSSRGAFDVRLGVEGELRPEGFYERDTLGVDLEAPTRLWGTTFSGGYRIGDGDAASYDAGALTDDDGEFSVGVEIPLLRGGWTDKERTRIAKAEIDLRSLSPEAQLRWISVVRDASLAYWNWVAAGRRLGIAERLLSVAEERQSQIERRVRAGAEPEIDLVDNGRLIVERRARLRRAVQDFEQASITLSLYRRDDFGSPSVPGRSALPPLFPAELLPPDARIRSDLEHAGADHPRLRQLDLAREKLMAELGLARNELLPELDFEVKGSQDMGRNRAGIDEIGSLSQDSRDSTEIMAKLRLSLPLQMRDARGRATAAQARVSRLEAEARLARDRILAEVYRALAGLRAALDQTEQARENVRLAQQLRDAESRRFALGLSNLIDVNIREIQAATASQELVDAQAAFFRSLATYVARVGRPPASFLRDGRWIPGGTDGAS
ncbi:MAG: TolC family protein [bacterium]|nr:TolC family protein [bacterium]